MTTITGTAAVAVTGSTGCRLTPKMSRAANSASPNPPARIAAAGRISNAKNVADRAPDDPRPLRAGLEVGEHAAALLSSTRRLHDAVETLPCMRRRKAEREARQEDRHTTRMQRRNRRGHRRREHREGDHPLLGRATARRRSEDVAEERPDGVAEPEDAQHRGGSALTAQRERTREREDPHAAASGDERHRSDRRPAHGPARHAHGLAHSSTRPVGPAGHDHPRHGPSGEHEHRRRPGRATSDRRPRG